MYDVVCYCDVLIEELHKNNGIILDQYDTKVNAYLENDIIYESVII